MWLSIADPQFLETAEKWIGEQDETLVLLRYAYSAGGRDFLLIRSLDSFRALLTDPPPRMDVLVYRGPQLQLRGVVDDEFIQRAQGYIPDGTEFLILGLDHQVIGQDVPRRSTAHQWVRRDVSSLDDSGETHEELRDGLNRLRGERVAIGPWPPWPEDDAAAAIEAFIPDPDGVVRPGAY